MATFARRLLGLALLTAAILIPGCQALFASDAAHGTAARPPSSDTVKQ